MFANIRNKSDSIYYCCFLYDSNSPRPWYDRHVFGRICGVIIGIVSILSIIISSFIGPFLLSFIIDYVFSTSVFYDINCSISNILNLDSKGLTFNCIGARFGVGLCALIYNVCIILLCWYKIYKTEKDELCNPNVLHNYELNIQSYNTFRFKFNQTKKFIKRSKIYLICIMMWLFMIIFPVFITPIIGLIVSVIIKNEKIKEYCNSTSYYSLINIYCMGIGFIGIIVIIVICCICLAIIRACTLAYKYYYKNSIQADLDKYYRLREEEYYSTSINNNSDIDTDHVVNNL